MKTQQIGMIALSAMLLLGGNAMAQQDVENYKRSTLYTVLLVSDKQNQKLDADAKKETAGAALGKSLFKNSASEDVSPSQTVQSSFFEIPIPDQFNSQNLGIRYIDFDTYRSSLTSQDIAEGEALVPKKKTGFGGALKGMAMSAVGNTNQAADSVEKYAVPIVYKMMRHHNIPDSMVAVWFNYGQSPALWDLDLVMERGRYAASVEELERARQQGLESGLGQKIGMDIIGNTYLMAINLRFRSTQAIMQETQSSVTSFLKGVSDDSALGASLIGDVAGMIVGDHFAVQACVYLFKLVWDEDIQNHFAEDIVFKGATLDDLINSGLCRMEYIGTEKAKSGIRFAVSNRTPQSELFKRATERAIDAAICKLQEKNPVFRTTFPISEVDAEGNVYAKVGMKEGLEKDDEYEILELTENKGGDLEWKAIGKVKATKAIWDNRAGAADELALDAEEGNSNKKSDTSLEAVNLGKTQFKGAKKSQDYKGYFLRLKKKK